MTEQLVLQGLQLRDDATFAGFFPGKNQQALSFLQQQEQSWENWFVYLWGSSASGRTHLLNAICLRAREVNQTAIYLPLAELCHLQPDIVDNLEAYDCICLDDIQAIVGKAEWEKALFHLYNRAQQKQRRLVVTAKAAPRELDITLADLKSRLQAGAIFHLLSLDDQEKLAALQLRAQLRGMVITDETGDFLLRRVSRDLNDLFSILDKLDHASLAAQRRLTIPFIKMILGL